MTARHGLGPHVVGQRIVLRHLVPGETGPSGGPLLTDVLGVCERWDDSAVAVRTAAGELRVVPLAQIVTGKPVPRRPAIRHRVSAREAESHVAALFPGMQTEVLGGWLLRLHPDPALAQVKRPNSLLAVGDPGAPVAELASRARAAYAGAGRRPLAHVEPGSPADRALRDLGWVPLGPETYAYQLASVAHLRRDLRAMPEDLAAAVEIEERDGTVEATVSGPDGLIGRGRAGLSRDWIGLHGLHVEESHRRRGVGRALVAALVDWGAEHGARTAWLHVDEANIDALRAYDSYGFATHHVMSYLTSPVFSAGAGAADAAAIRASRL